MTRYLFNVLTLCAALSVASTAGATEMKSEDAAERAEIEALLADPSNEMTGLSIRPDESYSIFNANPLRNFFGGEAVKFYSDGRLLDATQLPDHGYGFLKIFQPRNRAWGTDLLAEAIPHVGQQLLAQFSDSERLQIGDMSNPVGGTCGGHASHQNGLDADIAYLRVNRQEQDPLDTSGFNEDFVAGRSTLSPNFDVPRNFAALEAFVATGKVNRIFVDRVIKRALCRYAANQGWLPAKDEVLRRLRHWPNHQDHFHLRLVCPENSPQCVPQEDVAPGNGCNEV